MGEYQRKLRSRMTGKGRSASVSGEAPASGRMTRTEFHLRRRMFCVIEGVAHVAAVGDARYHREWMDDLVDAGIDERTYVEAPRGFYLAPAMVWYRGSFEGVSLRTICMHLRHVSELMGLPSDTMVYSGARSGPDDVLKGECVVGTVEDLLDHFEHRRGGSQTLDAR